MSRFLYPIRKLEVMSWIKYWLIKRTGGTLSEVLENLTSPITLQDSLRRKFKIFEISGNSVQNGEPLPTNPVPIQNVVGNVNLKVENKNLFDENSSYNVNASCDPNNYNYPAGTGENRYTYFFKAKSNTTYTFSCKEAGDRLVIFGKNDYINPNDYTSSNRLQFDNVFYVNNVSGDRNKTFTTGNNTKMVAIYYSYTKLPTEMMIEQGSTASSYAPHEEQTVTFPLAEGQVLHLGDTLENDGIHQRKKTVILDGTEDWRQGTQSSTLDVFFIDSITDYSISNNLPLCTHFIGISNVASASTLLQNRVAFNNNHTNYRFYIKSNRFSTVEELKAWLAQQYANGTPVTIEYELAEPIIVPYTEAQQQVYDEIKELYTYKGTTYISSDNEPSPTFTIQYFKEE